MLQQGLDLLHRAGREWRPDPARWRLPGTRRWGSGDQFEDPAGGDVLDQQGQFGEGEGQQVMELVDQPGALADDGLQPAGDLAQEPQLRQRMGAGVGRSVRAKRAAARASTGSDFCWPNRAAR